MRSLALTRAALARILLMLAAVTATVPTQASETTSYGYDALGRLVQVSHAGPINQGATATYQYDKADNRANATAITSWTSRAMHTGDFNGDGKSDILWRDDTGFSGNAAGTLTDWLSNSSGGWTDNSSNALGGADMSWKIIGFADVNGDGRSDILWRQDAGTFTEWFSNTAGGWTGGWGAYAPPDWKIVGVGDFNGDGHPDLLWRQDGGQLTDWLGAANGVFNDNSAVASAFITPDWKVACVSDLNGDGRADIVFRNDDGRVAGWVGNANGGFSQNTSVAYGVGLDWKIIGAGDFNGDGASDLLWRNDSGDLAEWQGTSTGAFVISGIPYYNVPTSNRVALIGNFNGPADHYDDILWRDSAGNLVQWLGTSNGTFTGNNAASAGVPTTWNLEPR